MSGEEAEHKLDWIDTPRGQRVPTWESTNEALKEVESILNELYEKLERVELETKALEQRRAGAGIEELSREIHAVKEELGRINERLLRLEDIVNSIDEKLGTVDYLSYLIEEELRKKRGD